MNPTEVWAKCLQYIQENVNEQTYKTWFAPIKPLALNNKVLTLQIPNRFFYEWLEEHHLSLLKNAITQTLGSAGQLQYQIPVLPTANIAPPPPTEISDNGASEVIRNPFVIPGIRTPRIDPQLSTRYTFENYVEGDCNRLARAAGIAVANKPGGTAFNPLLFYGGVGLGKTHLANAIGNAVRDKFQHLNVLYVTIQKFTDQFIEALKTNAVIEFTNFYQTIDVLIVDDVQLLTGKTKIQEMFFHIFNHLHQQGKQIILTSDKAPKDLQGMEERLLTRFRWGLVADIQIPDFETRIAIAKNKLAREGMVLSDEVIEFISFNIKSDIRALESALISLVARSSLNQQQADIESAKEIVKNFVDEISKEITIEFIQRLVADHYEVDVEQLNGKTRKHSVVMARQLSMYLSKNLTNKSLKTIGETFGGRDHSTVIYSCRAVQDMLDTDTMFKRTVEDLEKKIKITIGN